MHPNHEKPVPVPEPGDRRAPSERREPAERRASGDRRRNANTRSAVLHIGHSMLRVVVRVQRGSDQSDLAITRSVRWRDQAESLHSEQGAAELAVAVATIASEERLQNARTRVVLCGELCVTRALAGASEDVQRESALLRERSQLYLSLGAGKKLIASSSTPLDARHSHALLTVATEQTLRSISNAIDAAGMDLVAIGSSQVSLARTMGQLSENANEAALVVQLDEGKVELGVISGGRLFLDYRPGGNLRTDQLADLLSQHHTRLLRYCQRQHGLEGDKLTRVVISGAKDEASQAARTLKTLKDVRVELLDINPDDLPWEFRGEGVTPELASAIGAALAIDDEEDAQGPNLVDQLISNTRPPLGKMLMRKCAPLAAMLLVGCTLALLNWNERGKLAAMNDELSLLAPQAARTAQLRLELIANTGEIEQLQHLANKVHPQPVGLLMSNLTQSIPEEVWLGGIRFDGGQSAELGGSSYTDASIYDLVSNLQHVPGVADVALQGTSVGRTSGREATNFDIHLDLQLSGPADEQKEDL